MLRRIIGTAKKACKKVSFKYANVAGRRNIGKKIQLSLSDIYFMQFSKNELLRYDIIVRYLAIEEYYGKNDYGWEMYRKMQEARAGRGDSAVKRFHKLIESYEKSGYRKESRIIVDQGLNLVDGSHRIAMNIYFGIPTISAVVEPGRIPSDFSLDWFFQNGYSDEEIDIILKKEKELTEKMNLPFAAVIWDSALDKLNEILKDISYYGSILGYHQYSYTPDEYKNIVRAIYACDDIARWKVEKKIEYMGNAAHKLVCLELQLDFPDFRIKDISGAPLSIIGERVKKSMRMRYKPFIKNYYHDVIFHMADNYLQSQYMSLVFEPGIDFEEILMICEDYTYALTKIESAYYPVDFPKHIPVGKDVDILCLKGEIEEIVSKLKGLLDKYNQYEIKVIRHENGILIRFEKMRNLIFQMDLRYAEQILVEEFFTEALQARKRVDGYYRLTESFECVYRLAAYQNHRTKEHHADYIKKHSDALDKKMAEKYCKFNVKSLLNSIIVEE